MAYRKTDRELDRLRHRRDRVVLGACEVVQRSGFGAARARDIADASGVSVGSLYSDFDGLGDLRAEVFRLLAERELRRVAQDVEAARCPGDALAVLVRGFGARSLAAPMVAWALLLEPVSPAIEALRLQYRRDYADLAASIIRDGIEALEFVPQSVEVSASSVIGAIAESLVRPLDPAMCVEAAAGNASAVNTGFIEEIVQFCLRAVGAAPAPVRPETCRIERSSTDEATRPGCHDKAPLGAARDSP